jgi:hypothetical protein
VSARADLAAASLAHGRALSRLLRAQGHRDDADGLEAALRTAFHLLADEVGRDALSDAVARLANDMDESLERAPRGALRH